MTTYFTDPFPQANGSAWNASFWTSLFTATGSSSTVQGGRGRQNAGTSSGPSNKRGDRYAGTNRADYEWSGKFVYTTSADGSAEIWLRASTSAPDGTGYFLKLNTGGSADVILANGFSYSNLGTIPSLTLAQNVVYGFKFYVIGTTIKAKVWNTSGAEPGSYQVSVTNSAVAAAGYAYIATLNGGGSGVTFEWDDITLTDGQGNSFTFTSTVTSSGTLQRAITKNPFTATTTATGAFSYMRVVVRTFTAACTAVGTWTKQTNKVLGGSVTITGQSIKRSLRTFTASVTSSGTFRKSSVRVLTATVTATGTFAVTFLGRVFGRPGRTVINVVRAAQAFIRIRRT